MEYGYQEIKIGKNSSTMLEYVQELKKCCVNNLKCMNEVMRLSHACGMDELNLHMEKGAKEMEKTILWMQAAVSYLENM